MLKANKNSVIMCGSSVTIRYQNKHSFLPIYADRLLTSLDDAVLAKLFARGARTLLSGQ